MTLAKSGFVKSANSAPSAPLTDPIRLSSGDFRDFSGPALPVFSSRTQGGISAQKKTHLPEWTALSGAVYAHELRIATFEFQKLVKSGTSCLRNVFWCR
jgi:hypothetical protein